MNLVFMSVFGALCYWRICATPHATVAKLSHCNSYLLLDGFVSYYPVELIFKISIPPNTQQCLREVPTGSHQLRSANQPRTQMCMIVYLARDIPVSVMYCVYGASRSSLLIESTNPMINILVSVAVSRGFKQF